ncbi:MAG: hypothetical protein AAF335_04410, partial [Bacteroidota bacterium]
PNKKGEIIKIENVSFIEREIDDGNWAPEEEYKLYKELSNINEPIHGILVVLDGHEVMGGFGFYELYHETLELSFKMNLKERSLPMYSVVTKIDKLSAVDVEKRLQSKNDFYEEAYIINGKQVREKKKYKRIIFDPLNILSEDGDEEGIKKLQQVIDGWNESINIKDILIPQENPKEIEKRQEEEKKNTVPKMIKLLTTELKKDSSQVKKLVNKAFSTTKEVDLNTLMLSELKRMQKTFSDACDEILLKTIPDLCKEFNSKMSSIEHVKDFLSERTATETKYKNILETEVTEMKKKGEAEFSKKISGYSGKPNTFSKPRGNQQGLGFKDEFEEFSSSFRNDDDGQGFKDWFEEFSLSFRNNDDGQGFEEFSSSFRNDDDEQGMEGDEWMEFQKRSKKSVLKKYSLLL